MNYFYYIIVNFIFRCTDLNVTPGDADFYTLLQAVNELSPIFMTHLTFLPILKTLCSPEQARLAAKGPISFCTLHSRPLKFREWITKAMKFEILGCYAQTELGMAKQTHNIVFMR